MRLYETTPGDFVVVEIDHEPWFVEVARLLGIEVKRGRPRDPELAHGVFVHRLDPESLTHMPFDAGMRFSFGHLPADIEVVEVVAPISFLRRLRYAGPVRSRIANGATEATGAEVDPMQRMHDNAVRDAYQDEIPF